IKSILLLAMGLSFKEQISSYIRSLPNVERKYDPMSEEAYFYGLRNFAHFHGPQHIDIRLSKPQQEEALRTHMAIPHQYAPQAGWVSCIIETKEQANNTKRLIKQAYDTCISLKSSHKS
ncbi:MAG: luciferase family protein, partial [Nitrososphaeraceae archaeon]